MAEIEHVVKVLTLDESFGAELKRLEEEGYELLPGVLPVVVYNLIRKKKADDAPTGMALGKIKIDETKVHVLRDGNLIPLSQA